LVEVYSGGRWGCHRRHLEGLVFLKKVMGLCSVCSVCSCVSYLSLSTGVWIYRCVFVGWRYRSTGTDTGRLCDIR